VGTRGKRGRNVYIPAGAQRGYAREHTEGEQANHTRDERQPRRESLALVLLRGRPQTT